MFSSNFLQRNGQLITFILRYRMWLFRRSHANLSTKTNPNITPDDQSVTSENNRVSQSPCNHLNSSDGILLECVHCKDCDSFHAKLPYRYVDNTSERSALELQIENLSSAVKELTDRCKQHESTMNAQQKIIDDMKIKLDQTSAELQSYRNILDVLSKEQVSDISPDIKAITANLVPTVPPEITDSLPENFTKIDSRYLVCVVYR